MPLPRFVFAVVALLLLAATGMSGPMPAESDGVSLVVALKWNDPRLVEVAHFTNASTTPAGAMSTFPGSVQATIEKWWIDPNDPSVTTSESKSARENISHYVRAHNPPIIREMIDVFATELASVAPTATIVTPHQTQDQFLAIIDVENVPLAALPLVQQLPSVSVAKVATNYGPALGYACCD